MPGRAGTLAFVWGVMSLSACPPPAAAQVALRGEDERPVRSVATGGEIRQQYERFANEAWSAEAADGDGYWLQRYMWHVDARVSRRVRLYGEVKSGIQQGRAGGSRPPDEDRFDVHQGFVDLSSGPVTARIGRQELAFGSQRLVSAREGPNVRQTFDAGSVILTEGRWRVHGFAGRYVRTERGVLDDSSGPERALWGVYAVRSLGPRSRGVDLYYLGYRRDRATFDQGEGPEVRHSWGARIWSTTGALDYNVEAVAQLGRFADTDIRAWTIASETGYRIQAAGRPRVSLRADMTSGDRDRHDERLETFNALFPKGAYFGLIAAAGPSNHIDLHPQAAVNLDDGVVITASWLFFWRQQVDDGLYGVPGDLLRSGRGTNARFVGHSPGLEVELKPTERLTLTGNASLFTAGPFIQESGPAHTVRFAAGWVTYRF